DQWKSHKANLATNTGVSEQLRRLAGIAHDFDEGNQNKHNALVNALNAVSNKARDAEREVKPAFPKTKQYLVRMKTVAGEAAARLEREAEQRQEKERMQQRDREKEMEKEQSRQRKADLIQALTPLAHDPDKYLKMLGQRDNLELFAMTLGAVQRLIFAVKE